MDGNRDRPDRPEVSMGDWRSGPRVDSSDGDRRTGGFNRDRGERERDRDRERDGKKCKQYSINKTTHIFKFTAPIERGWREGDRPNFRDNRDNYNERGRFERSGFGPSRRNDRDDRNGGISRNRDDAPSERR